MDGLDLSSMRDPLIGDLIIFKDRDYFYFTGNIQTGAVILQKKNIVCLSTEEVSDPIHNSYHNFMNLCQINLVIANVFLTTHYVVQVLFSFNSFT
jgi:hypothetical protein